MPALQGKAAATRFSATRRTGRTRTLRVHSVSCARTPQWSGCESAWHSAGDASRLAALLLVHIRPAWSLVAPSADFTSAWLSNSRNPGQVKSALASRAPHRPRCTSQFATRPLATSWFESHRPFSCLAWLARSPAAVRTLPGEARDRRARGLLVSRRERGARSSQDPYELGLSFGLLPSRSTRLLCGRGRTDRSSLRRPTSLTPIIHRWAGC